ncbi:MAG TPA: (2Fe-2S)-binding protein [Prolixibacteraceae bacterium]|nr:(2Fe-2S)-binding protein [Prolixibacteraceae bacterium]
MVCHCKMVSIKEIKRFSTKYPNASFDELMLSTGVSTGCGRCKSLAQSHFDSFRKNGKKDTQLLLNFER